MKQFLANLRSIVFWSIISAAFIGPGTVTTAAKSGSSFGLSLMWALTFSIIGTCVLQEAAARLSIVSGRNIGEILSSGKERKWGQLIIIFLAVAFGCAAYQAGNILGAVSGMALFADIPIRLATLIIFCIGFGLLLTNNYQLIASLLGVVVAIMGFSFIYVALKSDVTMLEFGKSIIIPSMPPGADLLIIGLIGTTMVPYNIFLGNGIKHGQELKQMRIGLITAIIIGGIISMSIMVVGTQVTGEFSFALLEEAITNKGGQFMGTMFGVGLMAAGLSSSITSPLAAAITAKSTFNSKDNLWSENSVRFKIVWMTVMGIGLFMGLLNLKVIPVIIAAQAINGLLLPVVACYLLLIVNRKDVMGAFSNGLLLNILSLLIIGVCFFVGFNNIFSAAGKVFSQPQWSELVNLKLMIAAIGVAIMAWVITKKR